jgi:hypothetical protein
MQGAMGHRLISIRFSEPLSERHIDEADRSGNRKPYQDLATKALPIWKEWTRNVHHAPEGTLPEGLQATDTLYDNCGFMRLAAGREMSQYHSDNLDAMEKEGSRHEQFVLVGFDHSSLIRMMPPS